MLPDYGPPGDRYISVWEAQFLCSLLRISWVHVHICVCTSATERSAVSTITGTPRGPIRRLQIRPLLSWSWCSRWRGPGMRPRPSLAQQSFTAGTVFNRIAYRGDSTTPRLRLSIILMSVRSAGIGRTGCFIATSILCKQLRTEGVADILRTMCQLRLDR